MDSPTPSGLHKPAHGGYRILTTPKVYKMVIWGSKVVVTDKRLTEKHTANYDESMQALFQGKKKIYVTARIADDSFQIIRKVLDKRW